MIDVFISFVSQDRQVAQQLMENLEPQGLTVKLIPFGLGDSLMRKLEQGFQDAEYGIIILSLAFFQQGWANSEYDRMAHIDREFRGKTLLYPVRHQVTQQDVGRYSSELALRARASTDQLDMLVGELIEIAKGDALDSGSNLYNQTMAQQKAANINKPAMGLYQVLIDYFNQGELADLAFEMDIDFEEIAGENKSGKARELIGYCQRRGRLEELMERVQSRRNFIHVTL